jgi:hypothetical protein
VADLWLDDEHLALIINNQKKQLRFFCEVNIILSELSSDNSTVDDLFEALVMQRGRLKEFRS